MTTHKTFNENHPELQQGEMWLTNDSEDHSTFGQIGFLSKRLGTVAYDVDGNPVKGLRPVFVNKKEYEDHVKSVRMYWS